MQKISLFLLTILLLGIIIPIGFSTAESPIVITYGETTHNNANYKNMVDDFFVEQADVDLNTIDSKIITAAEVNEIASTITGKTYNSNQIYSSALVDLNDNTELSVSVDKSKITRITGEMYISALKSVGITKGHVYVTSPITATGESALAGIMNSYEVATDVDIPDTVKEAANNEIYTQARIIENSNVDADNLSELVNDVKEEVETNNITDFNTIVEVINNLTNESDINLTASDIQSLASSIEELQNIQKDIEDYQTEVSDTLNETSVGNGLLEIFNQK